MKPKKGNQNNNRPFIGQRYMWHVFLIFAHAYYCSWQEVLDFRTECYKKLMATIEDKPEDFWNTYTAVQDRNTEPFRTLQLKIGTRYRNKPGEGRKSRRKQE